MNKKWYAVYTKPRREKKIAEQLFKIGIENYCPLNRVQRQWQDRKKIIYEPLFTSYVFLHVEDLFLSEVRKVDGIINFVYWLKKPLVIRDEEIDLVKKFLNDYENVKLEKVLVNVDDKVRILSGAFMNEEGNVISINEKSVKLVLPSLRCQMVAEVAIQNVFVINKQPDFAQHYRKKSGRISGL